uniref:Uncharacterized protein n=1 Tax=Anopheles farauti TaxID=69004 RepID=A0A182Q0I8_9DIPT
MTYSDSGGDTAENRLRRLDEVLVTVQTFHQPQLALAGEPLQRLQHLLDQLLLRSDYLTVRVLCRYHRRRRVTHLGHDARVRVELQLDHLVLCEQLRRRVPIATVVRRTKHIVALAEPRFDLASLGQVLLRFERQFQLTRPLRRLVLQIGPRFLEPIAQLLHLRPLRMVLALRLVQVLADHFRFRRRQMLVDPLELRVQLEHELVEAQAFVERFATLAGRVFQACELRLQLPRLVLNVVRIEVSLVGHFLARRDEFGHLLLPQRNVVLQHLVPLARQIGQILVAFVAGDLRLVRQPAVQIVHVGAELLEILRRLQRIASLLGRILRTFTACQHLRPPLVDVRRIVVPVADEPIGTIGKVFQYLILRTERVLEIQVPLHDRFHVVQRVAQIGVLEVRFVAFGGGVDFVRLAVEYLQLDALLQLLLLRQPGPVQSLPFRFQFGDFVRHFRILGQRRIAVEYLLTQFGQLHELVIVRVYVLAQVFVLLEQLFRRFHVACRFFRGQLVVALGDPVQQRLAAVVEDLLPDSVLQARPTLLRLLLHLLPEVLNFALLFAHVIALGRVRILHRVAEQVDPAHLLLDRGQLTLQVFVAALERLHGFQIRAHLGRIELRHLFVHPIDRFLARAIEQLHAGRTLETLLLLALQVVQMLPHLVDLALACLHLIQLRVTLPHKVLHVRIDCLDPLRRRGQIVHERFELAAGRFDATLRVVRAQHLLLVLDPLLEIVTLAVEPEQADGILQQRTAPFSQLLQLIIRAVNVLLALVDTVVAIECARIFLTLRAASHQRLHLAYLRRSDTLHLYHFLHQNRFLHLLHHLHLLRLTHQARDGARFDLLHVVGRHETLRSVQLPYVPPVDVVFVLQDHHVTLGHLYVLALEAIQGLYVRQEFVLRHRSMFEPLDRFIFPNLLRYQPRLVDPLLLVELLHRWFRFGLQIQRANARLDELLRLLVQVQNVAGVRVQFALQITVPLQQRLCGRFIHTEVIRCNERHLFVQPRVGLVRVRIVLVGFGRILELPLAQVHQIFERLPVLLKRLDLALHLGRARMFVHDQLLARLRDLVGLWFAHLHLVLERFVLLLQRHNGAQILRRDAGLANALLVHQPPLFVFVILHELVEIARFVEPRPACGAHRLQLLVQLGQFGKLGVQLAGVLVVAALERLTLAHVPTLRFAERRHLQLEQRMSLQQFLHPEQMRTHVLRGELSLQRLDGSHRCVDLAQQVHQRTHLGQLQLVVFQQLQQLLPLGDHLQLTLLHTILAVVVLLVQLVAHVGQIVEPIGAGQNVGGDGLVFLHGRVHLAQGGPVPRIRQHLYHLVQVSLAQDGFLLELEVQLLELLLPQQFLAQRHLPVVFGIFQPLPRFLDVVYHLPVLGRVVRLVERFEQRVDVEVEGFDLAALLVLGRFLHRSVLLERQQLTLDALDRVREVALFQLNRLRPDPAQQVRDQLLELHLLLVRVHQLVHDVGNTLAALLFVLHPRERVVVRGDIRQDGLFVRPGRIDVFRVQQLRYAQLPLRDVERMVEVFNVPPRHEAVVVEQIRPVRVDERVETETRAPRVGKIGNVHVLVTVRLSLAPQQQRIFGGFLFRRFIFFILKAFIDQWMPRKTHDTYHIDFDLLNLESQNDGPNQAKNKAGIMVDDIFRTDRFQANLKIEKIKTFKTTSRSQWMAIEAYRLSILAPLAQPSPSTLLLQRFDTLILELVDAFPLRHVAALLYLERIAAWFIIGT